MGSIAQNVTAPVINPGFESSVENFDCKNNLMTSSGTGSLNNVSFCNSEMSIRMLRILISSCSLPDELLKNRSKK